MIRAVLFDLDDTLFDHRHCARAALSGIRTAHACFGALDLDTFAGYHAAILEELHGQVLAGRLDLDAARIERFRRLFVAAGFQADAALAASAAAAYREGYLASRREVAGAAALLRQVREHAAVVIVSNNLLEEQQGKLRECGLDRYVDVLVVSEEIGVSKPDRRIFQVALQRAGCDAAEAVMVGDSWTNDIEGARAAGMRAVWFSREGSEAPDPDVPVITSLEPASDALKTIFGGTPATTSRVPARLP